MNKTIAIQTQIDNPLPTNIVGNIEYQTTLEELQIIDSLITISRIENLVIQNWINNSSKSSTQSEQQKIALKAITALRCAILRKKLRLSYRIFSVHLALCPVYQWFCKINTFGKVKVPSKSTLKNYEDALGSDLLSQIEKRLLGSTQQVDSKSITSAAMPFVSFEEIYADCTCKKINIHYPVDWLLLRDAGRTLMKATIVIRNSGLKNRMPFKPTEFLSRMNSLCIEMSCVGRKKDGKRHRKHVLRKMKKLIKKIARHALKHYKLFKEMWARFGFSRAEAYLILHRMENIFDQLPAAVSQSHERIIGERQLKSKEKILSLYEPEVSILIRKKAGSEVEFGNKLYLCEQKDGLIIDWQLYDKEFPSEQQMLSKSITRIEYQFEQIKSVGTDRGFDSHANRKRLQKDNIINGICPKDPSKLKEKIKDTTFRNIQKRRSQTEARISILNNYCGTVMLQKGFFNRKVHMALSILSHNLVVLARIKKQQMLNQSLELKIAA